MGALLVPSDDDKAKGHERSPAPYVAEFAVANSSIGVRVEGHAARGLRDTIEERRRQGLLVLSPRVA